jgi:ABC-type transport system involved in multi-copper enzyme maturation permease subunit
MLGTIIQREILEYLKSLKLLIGVILTVILITISTLINIGDYQQRRQDYLNAVENAEYAFRVDIFREPRPLSVLVQGKDKKLGNKLQFNYMQLPIQTSGYMGYSSQHRRFFAGFAAVDFAFVVRVVMSLLVIFLAYNAISEEKEKGTLKLALSNHLPRDRLLLGKGLGGLFVILGSLLIAAVTAALIMILHPGFAMTGEIAVRMLGITGLSALYLLSFYALTLFISVAFNRPSTGLLVLLQIWIFLIVIYPNLSVILAKKLFPLTTQTELAERKRALTEPLQEELAETRRQFMEMVRTGGRDTALQLRNVELNEQMTSKNYQVDSDYSRQMTDQMNGARTIGLLSPAMLFDTASQTFARTGMGEYERFMAGVERAWRFYIDHFKLRYTDIEAFRNSKVPAFSYASISPSKSFILSLPQWLLLFLFTVIFFLLGYTSFLRKDVR